MNYLDIIFLLNIMLIATYNTALYKDVRNVYGDAINKNILILDEFTSALDEKTENEIIESINKIKKTFIIVNNLLYMFIFKTKRVFK